MLTPDGSVGRLAGPRHSGHGGLSDGSKDESPALHANRDGVRSRSVSCRRCPV